MKVVSICFRLALVCSLVLGVSSCTGDTSPPPSVSDYTNPAPVAGAASVLATGQDTCYSPSGYLVDCASTGQDGELQKGVPLPSDRYTDNGDGTFTDTYTGLMWMKSQNCIAQIHPGFDVDDTAGDGLVTWQSGLDFATAVNAGTYDCNVGPSYTDWRVPNVREMESIIDFISYDPGIYDINYFYNYGIHLTSTTVIFNYAGGPVPYAYNNNGRLLELSRKSDAVFQVWLVRTDPGISPLSPVAATSQASCYDSLMSQITCAGTGQDGELQKGIPLPTPRFTDNTNGTVTDNLTGLMWLKEANCLRDLLPGLDLDTPFMDGGVTWQHALDFIYGLNYGAHNCGTSDDYTDWRLPNINELRSLANPQFGFPSISNSTGDGIWSNGDPFNGIILPFFVDSSFPPGFQYWSSTTDFSQPILGFPGLQPIGEEAMTMEINFGRTLSRMKTESAGVWPVRGGN